MKNIWTLFFLSGIFIVIAAMMMSLSVVTGRSCANVCSLGVQQQATAAPIPIGGASNVLYIPRYRGQSPNYYQDEILVDQTDLNNPASVIPVLRLKQIEDVLGKKLDHVEIASISPDGKMLYMHVYEVNNPTPSAYFASIDLSFLVPVQKGWDIFAKYSSIQIWSPDGSMIVGEPREAFMESGNVVSSILRRRTTKISYKDLRGYMPLGWSKDSSQIYLISWPDGNHLLAYNVRNGSQQKVKLGFLDKINRKNPSHREFIVGLGFSPVSDETLWLTASQDQITLYKTTADFTDATVLTTINSACCGYHFLKWSPNGQYVWLEQPRFNDWVINIADGSIVWNRDVWRNDKGQWRRYPCGWTPDSHFATSDPDGNIFSLWDPSQPDKRGISPPFSGDNCPLLLLP